MKATIEILPRALNDIHDARAWYEDQREGLGLEFEQTVDATLEIIKQFPEMYPIVFGNVRRCLLGRFPYGVFYELAKPDLILIAALFHASRDPAIWAQRFG